MIRRSKEAHFRGHLEEIEVAADRRWRSLLPWRKIVMTEESSPRMMTHMSLIIPMNNLGYLLAPFFLFDIFMLKFIFN